MTRRKSPQLTLDEKRRQVASLCSSKDGIICSSLQEARQLSSQIEEDGVRLGLNQFQMKNLAHLF